jgi:hypothetical protein
VAKGLRGVVWASEILIAVKKVRFGHKNPLPSHVCHSVDKSTLEDNPLFVLLTLKRTDNILSYYI